MNHTSANEDAIIDRARQAPSMDDLLDIIEHLDGLVDEKDETIGKLRDDLRDRDEELSDSRDRIYDLKQELADAQNQ